MSYKIARHITIRNGQLWNNDELFYEAKVNDSSAFLNALYQHFQIAYPKFHKMDGLSRLGFLAAEFLLKDEDLINRFDPYRIGIVLANCHSSLDTDLHYHRQLTNGTASPALFVYTLPNILIGEICIRQGIKGENIFFISDKYEVSLQVNYVNNLLDTNVIDACICGWVEWIEGRYEAFLYLVQKETSPLDSLHLPQIVQEFYKQHQ